MQNLQDLPQFWCVSISAGDRCSPGFPLGAGTRFLQGKAGAGCRQLSDFCVSVLCRAPGPCVGVELKSRPSSGAGSLELVWEMRACRLLVSAELINIAHCN